MSDYTKFLESKAQMTSGDGFVTEAPDWLYPFQRDLTEWALEQGRAAIFADCGLGKTPMQLAWADAVARHTNGRVLILTPLAVSYQTVAEGEKFGIETVRSGDGTLPTGKHVIVTNYERLAHFSPADFAGVVCDESSILKNFNGSTRQAITEFMDGHRFRLLCTATAAPNDYVELGTSCEALGVMDRKHMLSHFFTHDGGDTAKWRLKGHARSRAFWQWMCSWARACRRPSDIGFGDERFSLPPLETRQHMVTAAQPRADLLFDLPAVTLQEQRDERKRTMRERCEMVAELVNDTGNAAVVWCHMNAEGDVLESLIPDAVQVAGSHSDDAKEDRLCAFQRGDVRVMITKPTIAGFGLNWQHCAHQTFFPSHSFEQWYQAIRRSWRFGQTRPVRVDVVTSEGEARVLDNLNRKQAQADAMFENLVAHMRDELHIKRSNPYTQKEEVPSWL